MDSLVTAQVMKLTDLNLTLKKEARVNQSVSTSTTALDSLGWADELDVFRQVDIINRPTYRDAYEVTDGQKDLNSNLTVRTYTSQGNTPVAYVQFFYLDSWSRLKKIKALYREKNRLFEMNRALEMFFDDHGGKPLLTGFRVEGHQKMILSDSVHYSIQSAVIF